MKLQDLSDAPELTLADMPISKAQIINEPRRRSIRRTPELTLDDMPVGYYKGSNADIHSCS